MRSVRGGDEGFSLLEVLFASFIAFAILTALFSVIVASSGMGRIAKADVLAGQLAQLEMERVRSLPYESIGTTDAPEGQPVGVLEASEEATYQGFHFTITREVTWVDDPGNNTGGGDVTHDYKELSIQVRWEGGHTTPLVTYIRDKANDMPTQPMVVWTDCPAPNAVLFTLSNTTRVWNGTSDPNGVTSEIPALEASASIDASAGTVIRVEFWSGNRMFMAGSGSGTSLIAPSDLWPCDSYGTSYVDAYPIDLHAVDASGALVFPEGKNTVRVVAYSNSMAFANQYTFFTVDNTAPAFPTGSQVKLLVPDDNTDRYNGAFLTTWTVPTDGLDPTTYYDVLVRPNGLSELTYLSQYLDDRGRVVLGSGLPSAWVPTSFYAYQITLRPRSVRGLTGASAVSAYTSNCPRLTGTIFNQAANKKAANNFRFDLTLSTPQAGLAAVYGGTSILYDLYSKDGATYVYPGWGDLPNATVEASSVAATTFQVQSGLVYNKYFQVMAKVMSGSSVVATIPSNVVGPPATVPRYQQSTALTVP